MEKLVLENEYEIVVPLFGAAFAAPNKGTTILHWFISLSTVFSSTENRIVQGLSKAFALLNLSSWCLVMVERLFLAVPWGCLWFVIAVFPDHTHLLFLSDFPVHFKADLIFKVFSRKPS